MSVSKVKNVEAENWIDSFLKCKTNQQFHDKETTYMNVYRGYVTYFSLMYAFRKLKYLDMHFWYEMLTRGWHNICLDYRFIPLPLKLPDTKEVSLQRIPSDVLCTAMAMCYPVRMRRLTVQPLFIQVSDEECFREFSEKQVFVVIMCFWLFINAIFI